MKLAAGQRWYVVQTRPHAEAKAALHLERQGFCHLPAALSQAPASCPPNRNDRGALVPALSVCRRRSRYPMLARDSFDLRRLPPLCHGEAPVPVADAILQQFWRRHDEAGYVRLETAPRFAPGDKVRVADGVFSACLGLFESVTDAQRVAILVDLLGRKVKVVVDVELVEAA
jgi:transcriptional antiterminator RfaH